MKWVILGVPRIHTEGQENLPLLYYTEDKVWSKTEVHSWVFNIQASAIGIESALWIQSDYYSHVHEIPDSTARRIARFKLKRKAKELFGLPINSPAWLVADRYEDAGMMEEANTLRGK